VILGRGHGAEGTGVLVPVLAGPLVAVRRPQLRRRARVGHRTGAGDGPRHGDGLVEPVAPEPFAQRRHAGIARHGAEGGGNLRFGRSDVVAILQIPQPLAGFVVVAGKLLRVHCEESTTHRCRSGRHDPVCQQWDTPSGRRLPR
jgi:hypothetical protein